MAKKEKWEELYEEYKASRMLTVEEIEGKWNSQDEEYRRRLSEIGDVTSPEYKKLKKEWKTLKAEFEFNKKSLEKYKGIAKNATKIEKVKSDRDLYQSLLDELLETRKENEAIIKRRTELSKEAETLDKELQELKDIEKRLRDNLKDPSCKEGDRARISKQLSDNIEKQNKNQIAFSLNQEALQKELQVSIKPITDEQKQIEELTESIDNCNKVCELLAEGKSMSETIANLNKLKSAKTAEPKTAEPKAAEQEAAEPKVAEPKAAEQEAAEPKVAEPKAAEQEAAEQEAAEQEAAEQEAAEQEAAEQEAAEQEAAEQEAAEQEAAEQEAAEQEAAEQEAAEQEAAEQEAAEQEAAEQEAAEPAPVTGPASYYDLPENTEPYYDLSEDETPYYDLSDDNKELKAIAYNSEKGQYTYTYSDGETENIDKLGLLKRIREKIDLYKQHRAKNMGIIDSIKKIRKMDANITKKLKNDKDRLEKYFSYLKGEKTDLKIEYSFGKNILKDALLRRVVRLSEKDVYREAVVVVAEAEQVKQPEFRRHIDIDHDKANQNLAQQRSDDETKGFYVGQYFVPYDEGGPSK